MWLNEIVNNRISKATGDKPSIKFESEKQYLQFTNTIPRYITSPFLGRHCTAQAMVNYDNNSYSVPEEYARKKVLVKERCENGIRAIDVYDQNNIIATHWLSSGYHQWIADPNHRKKEREESLSEAKSIKKNIKQAKSTRLLFHRPLSYYQKLLDKNMAYE